MFSRDEMQRAIEDALRQMEGVALELYRRGREPLLEELETVKRERDEARASCTDCAMYAERSARFAEQADRLQSERDEARAELSKLRKDYDSVLEANVGLLDGAPYVDARAAFRRGAEAMREACARWIERECANERTAWHVARLPIPEEA